MTLGEIEKLIRLWAEGLGKAGAATSAADLRQLADFLAFYANEPVAVLVQRAARAGAANVFPAQRSEVLDLASQLGALIGLLKAGGARAGVTNDLGKLHTLLGQAAGESDKISAVLDRLREAMQPMPIKQQIASFIERLSKDARTAAFERTFAELSASDLKREHMVEIANSVYGSIKKSTSRNAALAFIRKPHDAYMSAKRSNEATGGRSAA